VRAFDRLIVLHAGKVVQDRAYGWPMREGWSRDLARGQAMSETEAV